MRYPGWLVLNVFTLILAALLLLFHYDNHYKKNEELFLRLVGLTMVLIVMDSLGDFSTEVLNYDSLFLKKFGSYMIYVLDPLQYLFSIIYIDQFIESKDQKFKKKFLLPMKIYVLLNFIAVTISALFGYDWFYGFKGTVYYRGPLYPIRALINVLFCISVQIYVICFRRDINRTYRLTLTIFPAIVLFGGFLQILLPGLSAIYAATIVACLILFTYVQRVNLDMDYLTNTLNRRGLDQAIEMAVEKSKDKPFCAAMIDIDYFKQINDEFGHNKGDEALVAVAECMRNAFPERSQIGRYGGDEFMAVCQGMNKEAMKETIDLFFKEVDKYNSHGEQPFKLQISAGFDEYDAKKYPDSYSFRHHIDELMYEKKKLNHKR